LTRWVNNFPQKCQLEESRSNVKREGRTLFLLPKVKVEFRHLFSLQKPFSLCSYHNINANIVVFCWLTGLQWYLLTRWVNNFPQKCQFKSFEQWKLTLILSPYKPEMNMLRSCPDCLEFKNECYSTVNQSIREIIYSSCQKIFLKCCLPIFPDWMRQGKNIF
jgi:hypothetical protein